MIRRAPLALDRSSPSRSWPDGSAPCRASGSGRRGRLGRHPDEAAALVERWSAIEARGPGARVVLAMPNGHRQLLATLAVRAREKMAVPVNAQMRKGEIDHVIDDAGEHPRTGDGAQPGREGGAR